MADSSIVTLRLPQALIERADELAPKLSEDQESFMLGRMSRSLVLRLAVLRGLEVLEAQVQADAGSRSTKPKSSKRR